MAPNGQEMHSKSLSLTSTNQNFPEQSDQVPPSRARVYQIPVFQGGEQHTTLGWGQPGWFEQGDHLKNKPKHTIGPSMVREILYLQESIHIHMKIDDFCLN